MPQAARALLMSSVDSVTRLECRMNFRASCSAACPLAPVLVSSAVHHRLWGAGWDLDDLPKADFQVRGKPVGCL